MAVLPQLQSLLSGEDHDGDLTRADYLHNQVPLSRIPVPHQDTQQAWQTMAQSYMGLPRIARLVREPQSSPRKAICEQVVDLFHTAIDPDFLSEATPFGQLWYRPLSVI